MDNRTIPQIFFLDDGLQFPNMLRPEHKYFFSLDKCRMCKKLIQDGDGTAYYDGKPLHLYCAESYADTADISRSCD